MLRPLPFGVTDQFSASSLEITRQPMQDARGTTTLLGAVLLWSKVNVSLNDWDNNVPSRSLIQVYISPERIRWIVSTQLRA